MSPFLAKVFALLTTTPFSKTADPVQTPAYKYTVFADSDAVRAANALTAISQDLGLIDGEPWLGSVWTALNETKAVTQNTALGPAAAYIWAKWTEDAGTLEDIVLECLSDAAGLQKTLDFLDERFNWNPPADAEPKQVCAISAKRLKAAFCLEGQRKKLRGVV